MIQTFICIVSYDAAPNVVASYVLLANAATSAAARSLALEVHKKNRPGLLATISASPLCGHGDFTLHFTDGTTKVLPASAKVLPA